MQHYQFFSVICAMRISTEKRFGKDVELEEAQLY